MGDTLLTYARGESGIAPEDASVARTIFRSLCASSIDGDKRWRRLLLLHEHLNLHLAWSNFKN